MKMHKVSNSFKLKTKMTPSFLHPSIFKIFSQEAAAGNKKQTKGHQNIQMKKIVKEDDRLIITFSGLFKKYS